MYRLIVCLPLLLALAGCGAKEIPYTDHTQDAEAYAGNIKRVVLDHVAQAKTSEQPDVPLQSLVRSLERAQKGPTGGYKATYDEMLTVAREALEASQQAKGRPRGLDRQLQQLESLAEKLPGSVPAEGSAR